MVSDVVCLIAMMNALIYYLTEVTYVLMKISVLSYTGTQIYLQNAVLMTSSDFIAIVIETNHSSELNISKFSKHFSQSHLASSFFSSFILTIERLAQDLWYHSSHV